MVSLKWWALIEPANEADGGDGKRVVAQQWFWWPSNILPEV